MLTMLTCACESWGPKFDTHWQQGACRCVKWPSVVQMWVCLQWVVPPPTVNSQLGVKVTWVLFTGVGLHAHTWLRDLHVSPLPWLTCEFCICHWDIPGNVVVHVRKLYLDVFLITPRGAAVNTLVLSIIIFDLCGSDRGSSPAQAPIRRVASTGPFCLCRYVVLHTENLSQSQLRNKHSFHSMQLKTQMISQHRHIAVEREHRPFNMNEAKYNVLATNMIVCM